VSSVSAATTATWLDAVDGQWDDASKWSTPVYPDNGSPAPSDTYDVVIDAAGDSYTVDLDTDVSLDSLTLDSADATLYLYGGPLQVAGDVAIQEGLFKMWSGGGIPTIRGGRLDTAEGMEVEVSRGRFDGVTVAGDVRVTYRNDLYVANSLTLDGGRIDSSGDIRFEGGPQTIAGNGEIRTYGNVSELRIDQHEDLTLEPGVRISGAGDARLAVYGRLINHGVIAADSPSVGAFNIGASGYIGPWEIVNEGVFEASNGGTLSLPIVAGKWINNGLIVVDEGNLRLRGTFDQASIGTIVRNGGSVVIAGTLDNAGKTLRLDASTGSWELEGAIVGGTVETHGGAELFMNFRRYGSERLDGVVINGNATAYSQSEVIVQNGLTVNGQLRMQSRRYTEFMFEGTQTLDGTGELVFFGGVGIDDRGEVYPSEGVLTIGPEMTIRTGGAGGFIGDPEVGDGVLNHGTISAQTPGKSILIRGANFGNRGIVEAVGGGSVEIEDAALRDVSDNTLIGGKWIAGRSSTIVLGSATILTNHGDVTLSGSRSSLAAIDTLQENRGKFAITDRRNFTTTGDLDNQGQLTVGHHSTLRISGAYQQQAAGELVIELAGLAPGNGFGLVDIAGTATLDGTISVVLSDGFVPRKGDTFDVLDFGELTLLTGVDELLWLDALPSGLRWESGRFADDGSLTVIPEPGTFLLAVVGLLALAGYIGRKCGRAARWRRLRRSAIAAVAAIAFCAMGTAGSVRADDVFWQNPGTGDWSDAGNWDLRVPERDDAAYIDNGGTAQITSGASYWTIPTSIYVGYDGTGVLEHSAGDWTDTSTLRLGTNAGSSGTYRISGTASASFRLTMAGGSALLEQTGGTLDSYEAYIYTNGTVRQSAGTYEIGSQLYLKGRYELSGTGHLVNNDLRVCDAGSVLQTGGRHDVSEVLLEDADTVYRMEAGECSADRTEVREGTFLLSGGTMAPGSLRVREEGSFTVSGGTLIVSDGVDADGQVSFQSGDWSIDVQGGFGDFAESSFADLTAASFTSQPGTLTLFPTGFDPAQLASYNPAGMVHVVGSDLHIPSGESTAGHGTIPDHLVVEGSLAASHDWYPSYAAIDVLDGIEVRSGGQVELDNGTLVVNDHTSGIDSGSLSSEEFYVGKDGSGSFTHTAGIVTRESGNIEIYVGHGSGASGYYELSGDALLDGEDLTLGKEGAEGHFRQLGGIATVKQVSVRADGLYELLDGDLHAYRNMYVNGRFIQTGGYHEDHRETHIASTSGGTGVCEVRGGTHQMDHLHVGVFRDSNGTYLLSGPGEAIARRLTLSNGLFRQEGGTASVKYEASVVPHEGYSGRIELVDGDFAAAELILNGPAPGAAVFEQTGGTATFGEMRLGSSSPDRGGHYYLRGGELVVSGTATIGAHPGESYDEPGGVGVLEIGDASASFHDLAVGEDFGHGGSGTLNVTSPNPWIELKGALKLGANAIVSAAPGATIRMVGSVFFGSPFENQSTDETALAGLNNLGFVFEGGPYVLDPLEVAGEDLGPVVDGLALNFALESLQIGDGDVGRVQLVDEFDNQLDGGIGNEALYVSHLEVGPRSLLDLNGLNLYYMTAQIDPSATIELGGGQLLLVPEPSTLALLSIVAVALLVFALRRPRRRLHRAMSPYFETTSTAIFQRRAHSVYPPALQKRG